MTWQRTLKLIVVWIAHIFFRLLVALTTPIFTRIYEKDRHKFTVPPAQDALLLKPAIELASLIRQKKVCVRFQAYSCGLSQKNFPVTEKSRKIPDSSKIPDIGKTHSTEWF